MVYSGVFRSILQKRFAVAEQEEHMKERRGEKLQLLATLSNAVGRAPFC